MRTQIEPVRVTSGRAPGSAPRAIHPRVRERVFRAPLWQQFTEGTWGFALALVLPGLALLVGLAWVVIGGGERAHALMKAAPILLAGLGPLLTILAKGVTPSAAHTAKCALLALGEDYIRPGMSFLRPKIRFAQIVDVERGWVGRDRQWHAAGDAYATLDATAVGSERMGPGKRGAPVVAPRLNADRVRVRFVMRGTWEVVALAYPSTIDPDGELTSQLELAARRTRHALRLGENASAETVAAAFLKLQESHRDTQGEPNGTVYPDISDLVRPGARGWEEPEETWGPPDEEPAAPPQPQHGEPAARALPPPVQPRPPSGPPRSP